jgi:LDH2 family malate/lactate/ureidoglycolate dehydrogenase
MQRIPLSICQEAFITKYSKRGLTPQQCQMVFEHLVYAETRGKGDHGFSRLPRFEDALELSQPNSLPLLTFASPSICFVDGQGLPGYIAAQYAINAAIESLVAAPFAIVGVTNSDSLGVLGYYTRQLALAGSIGIACCTSVARIAVEGSFTAFSGTNPLSIAVPRSGEPLVYDAASSKTTIGSLLAAIREGKEIDLGLVLNSNGEPSTNPSDYSKGSLVPEAAHKGSGLAFMIELLAGAILGAPGSAKAKIGEFSALFIAFKTDTFGADYDVM